MPAVDAEALRRALAAAVDDEERTQCARRLGQALAGSARPPSAEDPPEAWVAAICQVQDKALAQAWLAGLAGDAWLGEVAMLGRYAEVRLVAAQRIEDTAVLEQVAQVGRDKDRGVYRHCSDLLRQRRQAGERDRRAAGLAASLRELLEGAPLLVTNVLNLEKEVRALGKGGESLAECERLLARAHERLQEEAEALGDLRAWWTEAAALQAECRAAAWPWTTDLNGWRARYGILAQALAGVPAWLAGHPAASALAGSLRDIETRLAALAADDERGRACEQFLDALAVDMAPGPDMVATWDALDKPGHPAVLAVLTARWQARRIPASIPEAVAEPAVAPVPSRPQPGIDREALREGVEALESAIEQGHLADADSALKRVDAVLGGTEPHGAMAARLRRAHAQLGELRGWARWGAGQAHEHLVAAAESLLKADQDVDALAVAVPALRTEWKRLNAAGPATKSQWEAFDAALEKAYLPVAARHAETAARHAEARLAKEALCAGWEVEWAAVDWAHADFTLVETRRQAMLKQWRAAAHASFRDERALRKRFDALLADLGRHLEAGRGVERARREQLILAAEALRDAPDLGLAMAEARALQDHWRQPAGQPRLERADEQKLWKRFRAACDAVFARRDAQRAEHAARREERARARRDLLEAFATVLASEDANAIKQALTRFRADWDAAKAGAREGADGLEERARELLRQAQARIEAQRQEKHRARFDLLARKAALAERIEAAAAAAQPLDDLIVTAQRDWDALPSLPGKAEGLLASRFAAAAAATGAGLAAGTEVRAALLLDLEIALDLPTPEAHAEARRARQLERLQDRFGTGSVSALDPEAELVRCYATAAAPDATVEQRLAAVVRRLGERGAANH